MYSSIKDRMKSARRQAIEEKKSKIISLCANLGIPVPLNLDRCTENELDSLISALISQDKKIEGYIR
jgi:hypothetical protein